MPEQCNVERFEKWRHGRLNLLETHASRFRATRVLHEVCKSAGAVTKEEFEKALDDVVASLDVDEGM